MRIKAMEHTITQNDPNILQFTGTAALMTDIFDYLVPRHTALQFRPEDFLAAFLCTAPNIEKAAATEHYDPYELIVRDPNLLTSEILCQGSYIEIRSFDDKQLKKKLGVSRLVKSDFHIVLRANNITVLTAVDNMLAISCLRYAEVL